MLNFNLHNKEAIELDWLARPIDIGSVTVRNRVFLAPMSGVTDLPFRQLAWEAGAGLVVSEMVASGELCQGRDESLVRLSGEGLGLHMVQLAGRDPYWMAQAACIAEQSGAHLIDINMGCPAKKVIGGYSGAALMRDVALAARMIDAVVKAVTVPVTLKMRLGWDEYSINAPQLAAMAEDLGVAMVTVHGRTRMQFYSGRADWRAIDAVRQKINIPLVVNGDIGDEESIGKAIEECGADAVMIGRACYGQPWLAGCLAGALPPDNISGYIKRHYHMMLAHYGEKVGIRHARKHLDWYVMRHGGSGALECKRLLMQTTDPQTVEMLIDSLFENRRPKTKVA